MLEIATDRRRIRAEPDEEAHSEAVGLARRFVEVQVGLARVLRRVAATRTFVAHDCVSIEEYGVRLGISGRDARQLVELGHALDVAATAEIAAQVSAQIPGQDAALSEPGVPAAEGAVPGAPIAAGGARVTVADAVLAGVLAVERAVAAGRLVSKPGLLRDGEDPVGVATTGPLREVRATIRAREEENAQHERVVPLALAVTERARDGFRRARSVASERAGTMLTEGETFSVVVERYLDAFDPLRRGEGTRRLPDTAGLPGRRTIPADVCRSVRRRSGEQCEVPGCPHRTFLEFAHVEPHREGGSREEGNLVRVCGGHHVLLDARRIRVAAFESGRPVFRDSQGRRVTDGPVSGVARTAVRGAPGEAADGMERDRPLTGMAESVPGGVPTGGPSSDPPRGRGAAEALDRPSTIRPHEDPSGVRGSPVPDGAPRGDSCSGERAGAGGVAERPPPYAAPAREALVATGERVGMGDRFRPPPDQREVRDRRFARLRVGVLVD